MIDQLTVNRRAMLLVGSSMLAATAMSTTRAAAQTQMPDKPKSETNNPPDNAPDEPYESPSRGRRVS